MEHWEKCCNILFELNKISESKRLGRFLDRKGLPDWFPNAYWRDLGFIELDVLLRTVPKKRRV